MKSRQIWSDPRTELTREEWKELSEIDTLSEGLKLKINFHVNKPDGIFRVKLCPSCYEPNGNAKKQCKCGYSFK